MDRLEIALLDIKNGRPIILVDDFDRENEGDLMIGASFATIENIAFMARWGRGIMCVPTTRAILNQLYIPMMVPEEEATDPYKTAFTVSVDAKEGVTTGVSAADRVRTLQVISDENSIPTDLARPGHLFPLRARDGLLKERRGHTEASVALMKMLEEYPVAVIAEIMNDDGSMAKMDQLINLASELGLNMISIEEIAKAAENDYSYKSI